MTLRVVGAGLGRTGTHSLKLAFEQLFDAPCYHMLEIFQHPEDIVRWQSAAEGVMPDWHQLFANYRAAVDWPASAYWSELADAFPDAIVVLSTRPTDEWWRSADRTIWAVSRLPVPPDPVAQAQMTMVKLMLSERFTPQWSDETASKVAYERHNERVRATVAPERLVEWQPGDGWARLCAALELPVPDTEFPHVNTTDEFRAMMGLP
ncbi:MAG: hypothetical protein E6G39_01295 [Actinobacteria bacterium]|nr:MAG: hypothetical protein E6G39_01295 [Actinomycetota bacterium]